MAANPLKGEIDAVIDGRTYTLCFTSDAIVKTKALGIPDIGHINMSDAEHVIALLWAALLKHHESEDLDILAASRLVDEFEGGMTGAVESLTRALRFRLSRIPIDAPLVEPTGTVAVGDTAR